MHTIWHFYKENIQSELTITLKSLLAKAPVTHTNIDEWRRGYGGAWPGKRNGRSAPGRQAGESLPPPCRCRWTIGQHRRRMGVWNCAQRTGLWRCGACVKQGLKSDGGDAIANRSLDAGYGKSTGPPIGRHRGRSAHLMSAVMRLWTVIFLVSYIEADWSGRICTAGPPTA